MAATTTTTTTNGSTQQTAKRRQPKGETVDESTSSNGEIISTKGVFGIDGSGETIDEGS